MSERIFKYALAAVETQILRMPADHKILCVQLKDGEPYLWAEICGPLTEPFVEQVIHVYPTGKEVDRLKGKYIGTIQPPGGLFESLVFHVYAE